MRESDARTAKYLELYDKFQGRADRDEIIARAMGWEWPPAEPAPGHSPSLPHGLCPGYPLDPAPGPDPDAPPEACPSLRPDPATEGIDWVRDEGGHISHPLCLRALNSCMAFWHACEQLCLDQIQDPDLDTLMREYQIAGAKLAGALNCLAYGRDLREGPFVVAYLKRALSHVHAAQGSLERLTAKAILPAAIASITRAELFAIREEILQLMEEFRGS
jgi:hypothetical protein